MSLVLSQSAVLIGLQFQLDLLAIELLPDDPDAIANQVEKLSASLGYSGQVLASAEYWKLMTKTPEARSTYTLAERLNNALSKAISAQQSVLSKLRAEQYPAKFQV